jgi:hypothetical protein
LTESAPDFYAAPGPKLSQGDFVDDVPWGLVPDPLLVCRPKDESQQSGGAFYAPYQEVARGGPAFAKERAEIVHARAKLGAGIVLWHDCEIDKFEEKGQPPEKWFAAVAPVILPSVFPKEIWEGITAGERLQFFPLQPLASAGWPTGACVDLRHIWPVRQSLLTKRIAALLAPGRQALFDHLFSFLTHRRLRDAVLCPNCHETISASDLFESTTAD